MVVVVISLSSVGVEGGQGVVEEGVLAFGDSLMEDGMDVGEESYEPCGDVFIE